MMECSRRRLKDILLSTSCSKFDLQDLKEEDVIKVEELVLKTLEELGQKGFEGDHIKAGVNTIEFQNRERNTTSFPKGLALFVATKRTWNYDKDGRRFCFRQDARTL